MATKTTVANKMTTVKRARVDAASPQTTRSEDVASLRAELEAAMKSIEQLRREKDYEVGRVRDHEQTIKALALKDLASEFHRQKQRDLEQLRESLRQRYEAESGQAARRYERNVQKMASDLDRCQNALRDELEKRGLSSSARAANEAERSRLLQELRDMAAAKRKADEAAQAAADIDRQRTAEMRRLQETCRLEVARVSKEANAEIRKLLEELKAKDHQLALLDRNQYSDRGASIAKPHPHQTADHDETSSAAVQTTDSKQTSTDDAAVEKLKADVERLTSQLVVSETERVGLKVRVEELRKEVSQRAEVINNMQHQLQEKQGKSGTTIRCQQKSVRFLLPGATLPVLAREVSLSSSEEDCQSICSDISELTSVSSNSSLLPTNDTATFFYDESVEKNYRMLLSEHVTLQRSVAFLLTLSSLPTAPAITPAPSPSPAPVLAIQDKQPGCPQECSAEKESMKATVETLKDKLRQSEESEKKLQQLLQEQQEQNEELEFRLFELENCPEKTNAESGEDDTLDDWIEKSQRLEIEVSLLKNRLAQYELLEIELSTGGLNLSQFISCLRQKNEQTSRDLESARSEITELRLQLHSRCGVSAAGIRQATALRDTGNMLEADDDSLCPMMCSMSSATSGFDDNSCASSVVDLKLDDMSTEDAWGSEISEEEVADLESSTPLTFEPADDDDQKSERCRHEDGQFLSADRVKEIEQAWAKRVEALEQKLQQSVASENRVRDQLALLGEEKNRRIAALQDQVDVLEANEFRLAETIQSLEQLEQTLSGHVLGTPLGSQNSDPAGSDNEVFSETTESKECTERKTEEDDSKTVAERKKVLKLVLPGGESPAEGRGDSREGGCVKFCCKLEKCFRRDACSALKNTIRQLRSAQQVHEVLDRRVQGLEPENAAVQKEENCARTCEAATEFEADYQELESLVKELKNVLFAENSAVAEGNGRDGGDVSEMATVRVSDVDGENCWSCCDNCCSLPTSPEFDLPHTSSDVIELELTEQYLRHQLCDLEKERDALYSTSCRTEEALRSLTIQHIELQSSEQSLRDEVSRLKAKEDWLTGRIDDLMELVSRLEDTVRTHQAAESDLKSRMERHQAGETDLRRELDNMAEELHSDGTKLRRRLAQLEDERDSLAARIDSIAERNNDLEGRELELGCRIKKMEAIESGLRKEVRDLQKALSVLGYEGQTDCLLHTYNSLVESSAAAGIELRQHRDEVARLNETVVCLKESVEAYRQSAVGLEARVRECVETERVLRGTVAEYERIDEIWQEKVHGMEANLALVTDKLQQVETELNDYKSRSTDFTPHTTPFADEWTQQTVEAARLLSLSSAVKGLVLLSGVVTDADQTESACWATVESAPYDDVTDIEVDLLTSPHWVEVEAYMGLGSDANTEPHCPSIDSACVASPVLESLPSVEPEVPRWSATHHSEAQPPPLPMSPPPDSPGSDRAGPALLAADEASETDLALHESRDQVVDRRARAASEGRDDVISIAKLNPAQKAQFSASLDLTPDTILDLSKSDFSKPSSFFDKSARPQRSHVDNLVKRFSAPAETTEPTTRQPLPSQIPRKVPLPRQSSTPCTYSDSRSRSLPNGAAPSVLAARSSLPVIGSSLLPTLKLDAVTSPGGSGADRRTKSGYSPELHPRTPPAKSYLPRYVGVTLKSPTLTDKTFGSSTRSSHLRVSLSSDVSDSGMDTVASAQHPPCPSDSKVALSGLRG